MNTNSRVLFFLINLSSKWLRDRGVLFSIIGRDTQKKAHDIIEKIKSGEGSFLNEEEVNEYFLARSSANKGYLLIVVGSTLQGLHNSFYHACVRYAYKRDKPLVKRQSLF